MSEQTSLNLIDEGILAEYGLLVSLTNLPPDLELLSPPPSRALLESVRLRGVLEPIVVTRKPGASEWLVVDGRRRIKAARAAGQEVVPASEVTANGLTAAGLSVHYHATRSANPLSDLDGLHHLFDALIKRGDLGEAEIVGEVARATGLAVGTVKARMKLLLLEPAFRVAVREGRLSIALAERIARLAPGRRDDLARTLETSGKLTAADVDAARRAVLVEQVEAFDWDQIDATSEVKLDDHHQQITRAVMDGVCSAADRDLRADHANVEMVSPGVVRYETIDGRVYRITVVLE